MAIVGDVSVAEAKRLAERYFGAMAARPMPPVVTTEEPPQAGPKTVVVEMAGTTRRRWLATSVRASTTKTTWL